MISTFIEWAVLRVSIMHVQLGNHLIIILIIPLIWWKYDQTSPLSFVREYPRLRSLCPPCSRCCSFMLDWLFPLGISLGTIEPWLILNARFSYPSFPLIFIFINYMFFLLSIISPYRLVIAWSSCPNRIISFYKSFNFIVYYLWALLCSESLRWDSTVHNLTIPLYYLNWACSLSRSSLS